MTEAERQGYKAFALWLHQRNARTQTLADEPYEPTDPRLAGDRWRLRGIPIIGVPGGLGGTTPGTNPEAQATR